MIHWVFDGAKCSLVVTSGCFIVVREIQAGASGRRTEHGHGETEKKGENGGVRGPMGTTLY